MSSLINFNKCLGGVVMRLSLLGISISLLGIALILSSSGTTIGLILSFAGVICSLVSCFIGELNKVKENSY